MSHTQHLLQEHVAVADSPLKALKVLGTLLFIVITLKDASKGGRVLINFWHEPCVFSLLPCHLQGLASGAHMFYDSGMSAQKNKSLPTFWQAHLCVEPSLKRLSQDRWRCLEIRYLPRLLTFKPITLSRVNYHVSLWCFDQPNCFCHGPWNPHPTIRTY